MCQMEMKKWYFIFKIQNNSDFLCILIKFAPYIFFWYNYFFCPYGSSFSSRNLIVILTFNVSSIRSDLYLTVLIFLKYLIDLIKQMFN